jgi:VanZ family protein
MGTRPTLAQSSIQSKPRPWLKQFWRAAFWLALATVAIAAIPFENPGGREGLVSTHDKLFHAASYAALAILGRLAGYPVLPLLLGLAAHGALIEIAQSFTEHRQGSIGDWVADCVGILLGCALFAVKRVTNPVITVSR